MEDTTPIILKDYWHYPNYTISNDGIVTNVKKNRTLKPCIRFNGYYQLNLCNGKATSYEIHRLVARHFIPNPNNYFYIEHINHNILDNNYTNLRWTEHSPIYK